VGAGGFFAAHEGLRLIAGVALVGANLALLAIVRNNVIRRRLRFTLWTTLLYIAVHLAGTFIPGLHQFDEQRASLEKLLLILAVISGAVSLFNPWFRHGVPDRLPSILQDTIVLAVFGGVAIGWFHEQLAITSAVGAAVIGFAAQDTLGNAFSGLAIQVDRPFKVGHWITVGSFEGLVTEITWRATKLRTKSGNLVVVPNNIVSKEAINNYSEPEAPTRLFVEIGASYNTSPNETKAAILAAVSQATRVLKTPPPDVVLMDFGASALTYRARFWVNDFVLDELARDEVRTFIYYEFRRRNIEIPYPVQVQYERHFPEGEPPERRDRVARLIATVPVFAALSEEAHRALAVGARSLEYAAGEAVVREGDQAASMFLVERGRVDVMIGGGHRVATTEAGGYFGEMSLLTGAARTATVTAVTDCALIEIDAAAFREYVQSHPEVLALLAAAAGARQQELDTVRATASTAPKDTSTSLLQKMKAFLRL
jgi:small-conductance mechanosensitive channel/CRP-like cAMP-binding protein